MSIDIPRPRLVGSKKQRREKAKFYRDQDGVPCFVVPSTGCIAKLFLPGGMFIGDIAMDFTPNPVLLFRNSEHDSYVIGQVKYVPPRRRTWTA